MNPTSQFRLKETTFTRDIPLLSIPMQINGDKITPSMFFKLEQLWVSESYNTREWRDIPLEYKSDFEIEMENN